jgi:hypothetical protein
MADEKKYQTPEYNMWIERIKKIKNISKKVDIAEFLGIAPASYSSNISREYFPHDKVVLACINEGISLDDIYYEKTNYKKNVEVFETFNDNKNSHLLPIYDKNIPYNTNVKVFESEEAVDFIDIQEKEIKSSGRYLVEKEKKLFLMNFELNFVNGLFIIEKNEKIQIKEEELKFKILGKSFYRLRKER